MRERPIPFSGPMVRAILDGRKLQTRRIVKPQPERGEKYEATDPWFGEDGLWRWMHGVVCREHTARRCPYGVPGDRLWVRETWAPNHSRRGVAYRADFHDAADSRLRWHPSIHMPRWASRLTLEVTGVRVERLRDISEADAIAEGCHDTDGAPTQELSGTARGAYALLWDDINAKRASWSSNPWVWVIEFRVATPEAGGRDAGHSGETR